MKDWFAVSQEVPSIVSGRADRAKSEDQSRQGVFKDVPSAKVRPNSLRDAVKTEPRTRKYKQKCQYCESRYILR